MAKSARVINEDIFFAIRDGQYDRYLEYVGIEVDLENPASSTSNFYGDVTVTYETVKGVRCVIDEESVKVLGGEGDVFNRFFEDSMPIRAYFKTDSGVRKGSRVKVRRFNRVLVDYRDLVFEVVEVEMADDLLRRGGKILTAYLSPFRKSA